MVTVALFYVIAMSFGSVVSIAKVVHKIVDFVSIALVNACSLVSSTDLCGGNVSSCL